MNRWKAILSLSGIAAAAYLVFANPAEVSANEGQQIAEGVYVGDTYVGGMTEAEAEAAVEAYAQELGEAVFTLNAGERSITAEASAFGVHFADETAVQRAMDVGRSGNLIKRYKDKKDLEHGDVVIETNPRIDNAAVELLLESSRDSLDQKVVNNGLTRENGEFQFVKGAQGIEVNIPSSVQVIGDYVSGIWDGEDAQLELVAEIVEPLGKEEELAKIQDLMGSYDTNFASSASGRCTNIEVATGKINGTVLYPGEEFSVADTIGPLVASNGYELAGAYENGQTVQSYGGGVCQVSTTLYNALILAELEITERWCHSMTVNYVKPSMDAAIAGDYKDLCFKNNYDTPIYIEGYTSGKTLIFNVFGEETRPANRKVTYQSEIVSTQHPPTQIVATGDPVGYVGVSNSSHTGYVARLWKVVTVDGVEESREAYNKSTYKATPRTVRVGTASADPNLSAIMGAAIATGDEAAIHAAAAQCAAAAAAQQPPVEQQPVQQPAEQQPVQAQPAEQQPVQEQPVEQQPAQ